MSGRTARIPHPVVTLRTHSIGETGNDDARGIASRTERSSARPRQAGVALALQRRVDSCGCAMPFTQTEFLDLFGAFNRSHNANAPDCPVIGDFRSRQVGRAHRFPAGAADHAAWGRFASAPASDSIATV